MKRFVSLHQVQGVRTPDSRRSRKVFGARPALAVAGALLVACTGVSGPTGSSLDPTLKTSVGSTLPPSSTTTTSWLPPTTPEMESWTVASGVSFVAPLAFTGLEFVGLDGSDFVASADGTEWEVRGALSSDVIAPHKVVVSESLVLVLGARFLGDPELPVQDREQEQAVWVSDDEGRSWRSVEASGFRDVAPLPGGGFVAVGMNSEATDGSVIRGHGVVWRSEDGLSWREALVVENPEGQASWMSRVVWRDGLVIIGSTGRAGSESGWQWVVWRSHDGQSLDGPTVAEGLPAIPTTLIDSAHGLMAVVDGRVWASVEGASWSNVDQDLPIGDEYWRFLDAATFDGRLHLLGSRRQGGPTGRIDLRAVWVSNEAGSWTRIDQPNWVRAYMVAASSDRLVVNTDDHPERGRVTITAPATQFPSDP